MLRGFPADFTRKILEIDFNFNRIHNRYRNDQFLQNFRSISSAQKIYGKSAGNSQKNKNKISFGFFGSDVLIDVTHEFVVVAEVDVQHPVTVVPVSKKKRDEKGIMSLPIPLRP